MRADWLLPDNQKLEVTMKTLNSDKEWAVSCIL